MNIFFISYGVWDYDGRLRQLAKVANKIGKTTIISRMKNSVSNKQKSHIRLYYNSFLVFIIRSIVESIKLKKIDILFVDNRKAIIPSLFIIMLKKPKKVILDVRELYLPHEAVNLSSKVGCFFEGKMIKKADILISANKYRSLFMKNYYKLRQLPLVYENIRKLEWTKDITNHKLDDKYKNIFSKNTFKIISSSGCSISRTNDKLVKAMAILGKDYELLLVGGGTKKDLTTILEIIKENNLKNIHIIDLVGEHELKYLISNSHIGIVNYHQNDSNNKYCASGKIFEFLFEGKPVVTTDNIPLKDFCLNYGIGISDNMYANGILEIKQKYDKYVDIVMKYISQIDVQQNNDALVNGIKERLLKK